MPKPIKPPFKAVESPAPHSARQVLKNLEPNPIAVAASVLPGMVQGGIGGAQWAAEQHRRTRKKCFENCHSFGDYVGGALRYGLSSLVQLPGYFASMVMGMGHGAGRAVFGWDAAMDSRAECAKNGPIGMGAYYAAFGFGFGAVVAPNAFARTIQKSVLGDEKFEGTWVTLLRFVLFLLFLLPYMVYAAGAAGLKARDSGDPVGAAIEMQQKAGSEELTHDEKEAARPDAVKTKEFEDKNAHNPTAADKDGLSPYDPPKPAPTPRPMVRAEPAGRSWHDARAAHGGVARVAAAQHDHVVDSDAARDWDARYGASL